MKRPNLDKNITLKDFNDFYWSKHELIEFCKSIKIPYTAAGKLEIADRIRYYICTGEIMEIKTVRKQSNFNWNAEKLTCETLITDNYKNGKNVRNFFIQEIGTHFSFNVRFLKWMKENIGRTLGDAVNEWKKINDMKNDKNYTKEISPQFEYNRYIRAFLDDNPNLSTKDAIKYWKIKKSERGTNEYNRKDLEL